jgi:hypothetical protein
MIEATLSSAAEAYLRAVSAGRRAKAPVRVCLEAAAALYKASRFEAAELVYRAVLKKRPNRYRTLLNLGYLARSLRAWGI